MRFKRTIAAVLLLLIAVVAAAAQSGRRIKNPPEPTPMPVSEDRYSESRPYKPVRLYPPNYKGKREEDRVEASAKQPQQDLPEGVSEEDVIRIESRFVSIPVSVYDKNGLYIPNLRKEEIKIFEDGVEQTVDYFGVSDEPFTVVLLLDTSPSTEYKIEEIQRAAAEFVGELRPEDSVIVIEFDGNVHVLTERTKDRQKIYKAIREADFGGGTSLYDSVEFALTKRLNKIEGRKAIVLFTDGVDTTSSKASYGENLEDAEEADTIIFPIYYNTYLENRSGGVLNPFPGGILNRQPRGTRAEDYALGKQYLDDIAAYTGGRVFNAGNTPGGLRAAFRGIAEELRKQYTIGYYPIDEGEPGQRKKIKVRIYRPDLIVRARDSYVVGSI